ncbi:Tm-1-like ATP-binding domain-containing protein [Sinisalibacter aestuarii]|uniref:UPF0261 protein n=1 Tax=Sinisalibacter aestuarii TaxID=2949426 RepID=A0ABQ5LYS7_9RHOB|nr:Tm-1-like ATP-binding domain-containing protein [Sinisalibacter aestuarii]GKY90134.1 UPF0261 protein [Sinisalibacter aestuarii]
MATKKKVLLIVTQDTKQHEAKFLRDTLEAAGVDVIHLDPSVRKVMGGAEISPDAVAAAAGMTLDEIRAIRHEGKIQEKMIEGSIKTAHRVHAETPISGILSIGGSMGTTLSTQVMQSFPYGMPKLMISTLASGMTAGFVGVKDIAMLNSVCDISGLNSISRDVYRNGANAVAGMARGYEPGKPEEKPLVLVSTLGTTEALSRAVREGLEADGCEVMVFHTTGNGGRTLEAICAERDVSAVVDMSLVEVNDFIQGGICAVGPERATTAVGRGIPAVFAPGNVDFFIMPSDLAEGDMPFEGRDFHVHNAALTAVRTTAEDLGKLAGHMGEIFAEAEGPIRFLVPLGGFSSHDSTEGTLHRPDLPAVFASQCEAAFPDRIAVETVDAHANDRAFADALLKAVRELMAGNRSA